MRVHFVAVSGTGMGALAGLFKSLGHEVSGSDTNFWPPMGPALRAWGIELMEGFDPKHLEPRPDLVVVGNVCRPWNPEAKAAIDAGLRYASMAHALAEVALEGRSPLVVGGTHGKTTTSAMCAHILATAGLDPGFLIGGLPKNFPESFRVPGPRRLPTEGAPTKRRTPFVVEGDEYDTAFFEKTPKFWHYRPEVGIVTSIEHDHVDIYPDGASYDRAFEGFVQRLPERGLLVASAHDPRVVRVARGTRAELAFYALSSDETGDAPPHWLAAPVHGQPEFDLYVGGSLAGRVLMRVPGEHNIRNATAAIAACVQGFGVPLPAAMSALESFEGVRRRQDLLYEVDGVRVIDDFAHHPTAVRETLAALRTQLRAGGRLWAVFEARSATACRSLHQEGYAEGFAGADRVVLAPLGRSDIPEAERLDLEKLCGELAGRGLAAEVAPSVDAIVARLAADARPGDTVALLSNGAFGGIYGSLEAALRARAQNPARSV